MLPFLRCEQETRYLSPRKQCSETAERFQPFRWNHGAEQDPLVVGTERDHVVVDWNRSIGIEVAMRGGSRKM
jgi:hypothetical protein